MVEDKNDPIFPFAKYLMEHLDFLDPRDGFGTEARYDRDLDEEILDKFFDIFDDYGSDIRYNHGMSKFVITIADSNYVIKIPFNYYDLTGEFTKAPFTPKDRKWDYCSSEVGIFNKIIKPSGFADMFCETRFFGYTSKWYPIYIQEKANRYDAVDYDDFFPQDYKSIKNRVKKSVNNTRCRNVRKCDVPWEWLYMVMEYFGDEKADEFFQFLDGTEMLFDDLHEGNVGFSVNDDRPVIFDYSSFFE